MPKRNRHRRNRTMRGGFWESLTDSFNNAWDKTKKATSAAYSSVTGSSSTSYSSPTYSSSTYSSPNYSSPTYSSSTYSSPTYSSTPSQPTSTGYMGGKTKRRRMRGGFKDNTPTTGLAFYAAPFSGKTAQPHNLVGGKSRSSHRHKHRHSKTCKHRR